MNRPHHPPPAHPPQTSLRAALAGAAAELNRHEPPAWLERATLARLPSAPAASGPHHRSWRRFFVWPGTPRAGWVGLGGLVGAMGVMGLAVLLLLTAPPPPDERRAAADGMPSGFVALASPDALAAAAARPAAAWLVATEMPRERLAALGLPFDPARAGESVRAELLMHGSGEVLAVRLLPE